MTDMHIVATYSELSSDLAVYANRFIAKGTIIFDVSKLPVISINNQYAITIGKGIYLDTNGHDCKYINHSCAPTMVFNQEKLIFTAARNIYSGEILTFDYTLTEIDIASSFKCMCGALGCKGYIGNVKNNSYIYTEIPDNKIDNKSVITLL